MDHGPILLTSDNFTTLERTPWAGENIGRFFKENASGMKIGESWEFSCDPALPSRIAGMNMSLPQYLAKHPDAAPHGCQILLKLLNANEPLSLQVHPDDHHPALKPGECGKPETWLILHAESGAGLYLGFSRRLTRKDLKTAIENGADIKPLLNFVSVKAGDFFEIEPGMPHAIGPGVTLLEPQRVLPGKSGKTYRLWDWGRKRELHLTEGLPIIDPEIQVGAAFAQKMRRKGEVQTINGLQWTKFPPNLFYQVHVFQGSTKNITLQIKDGYGAFVMLGGKIQISNLQVRKGQSALLPASAKTFPLSNAEKAHFAVVVPAGALLTSFLTATSTITH